MCSSTCALLAGRADGSLVDVIHSACARHLNQIFSAASVCLSVCLSLCVQENEEGRAQLEGGGGGEKKTGNIWLVLRPSLLDVSQLAIRKSVQ